MPTLTELAPKLGALVRRGVGLNTRAGAGRFITQARAAAVCRACMLSLVVIG